MCIIWFSVYFSSLLWKLMSYRAYRLFPVVFNTVIIFSITWFCLKKIFNSKMVGVSKAQPPSSFGLQYVGNSNLYIYYKFYFLSLWDCTFSWSVFSEIFLSFNCLVESNFKKQSCVFLFEEKKIVEYFRLFNLPSDTVTRSTFVNFTWHPFYNNDVYLKGPVVLLKGSWW